MTHNLELRTPEKPKSSKKKVIIPSVLGLVLLAGTAGFVLTQQPSTEPTAPKPLVVETGEVSEGDLIEQVRVQGKLGFSGQRDLGTELTGTVTGLPTVGSTIKQGQELFRIDDRPVILLTEESPSWRSFEPDIGNGPDVKQLETNLSHLGLFAFEPDEKFTASTTKAVKTWQKSLGLKQTGTVTSHGAPTEVEGGNDNALKIPVRVKLDNPEEVANLDNVTVTILLTKVRAQNVILVPTSALLAQTGGGLAVEVSTKAPLQEQHKPRQFLLSSEPLQMAWSRSLWVISSPVTPLWWHSDQFRGPTSN